MVRLPPVRLRPLCDDVPMDVRASVFGPATTAAQAVVGAVIAVGGLLLCAYLIKKGQSGWAVGAFLAEVATLAGLFVIGRLVRNPG